MRAIDGLILCGAVLCVPLAFLALGRSAPSDLCSQCGFMNGFPYPIEYGLPYPRLLSDFGRDGELTESEIQSAIDSEAKRPEGGHLIVQEANARSIIFEWPLVLHDRVLVNFDSALITCLSPMGCFELKHGTITNVSLGGVHQR